MAAEQDEGEREREREREGKKRRRTRDFLNQPKMKMILMVKYSKFETIQFLKSKRILS